MTNRDRRDIPLHVDDFIETPASKPGNRRRIPDLKTSSDAFDSDFLIIQRVNKTFKVLRSVFLGDSSAAHGGVFTNDGQLQSPVVTQTPGTTPVLFTGFTENGVSSNMTPDFTSGVITIDETGVYDVKAQMSFAGTNNATFNFEFVITSDSPPTFTGKRCTRKLGSSGDVGSASFVGLLSLIAGDVVGIYVDGGASDVINTYQAQLDINKVG